MSALLPLGSVVRLDTGDSMIMIMGYLKKVDGEYYDYMGVSYPVGLVGLDSTIVFRAEHIKEILFKGYLSEKGKAYYESVPMMLTSVLTYIKEKKRESKETPQNNKENGQSE